MNYATVDGSATVADNDYVPRSGMLTFGPASPTLQIVNVTVNGDTTFEANEVFFLHLSNPVNATIQEADGIGTIFNDDIEPAFSVNDISGNEGNTGTSNFVFTITRSGNPTSFSSLVSYSTANGTATAPLDFTSAVGTVLFAPNETSMTVTVAVNGDTTVEPNETFTLSLGPVSNGTIARAVGTATIVNDDGGPTPTPTPVGDASEGDVVDANGGPAGGDGVLSNDVNVVRQFALGNLSPVSTPNQFQRADVNGVCGDGAINAADVTVVRQFVLGTLQPGPACGPTQPTVSVAEFEATVDPQAQP